MAESNTTLLTFNGGEVSRRMDARLDLDQYRGSCRHLVNLIPDYYGNLDRRPGTLFVTKPKRNNDGAWLVGFSVNVDTNYLLELGDFYMRFIDADDRSPVIAAGTSWLSGTVYKRGDFVFTGFPSLKYIATTDHTAGATFGPDLAGGLWLRQDVYEISTPWTLVQLRDLMFAHKNDVSYITSKNYPLYKLSHFAANNWTLTKVDYEVPPMLDENISAVTIAPSGLSGAVTLTASAPLFQAGQVGGYFRLGHLRASNTMPLDIVGDATSGSLKVLGGINVRTYGVWTAQIDIERSLDNGATWDRVHRFAGQDDRNVDEEGNEPTQCLYRIVITNYSVSASPGVSTPRVVLEAVDAYIYATARITAITSSTLVNAVLKSELEYTTPTKIWSEGAFSSYRGFPRAICFHEDRMWLAGTFAEPLKHYGSRQGDYENHDRGQEDQVGDAVVFNPTAGAQNSVNSLVSETSLFSMTTGDEWSIRGTNEGEDSISAVKPPSFKRQSAFGSKQIQALLVNEAILYVTRSGKELREATFSQEKQKYVSPNLTLLAEHVTGKGIIQMVFQQSPICVLWCVTKDGKLVGLTYNREQGVVAWHRHELNGVVESVATVYGAEGRDQVWVSVARQIGNTTKRFIELINPDDWETLDKCYFVDCGVRSTGFAISTITGLDHLEGMAVEGLADGVVISRRVVVGGAIDLDVEATEICVGLPSAPAAMKPMRIDVDQKIGPTPGQTRQIHKLTVRVKDTVGFSVADNVDGVHEDLVDFREQTMNLDEAPPLFSGDKDVDFPGDFNKSGDLVIRQTQPLPLSLQGITVFYNVSKE